KSCTSTPLLSRTISTPAWRSQPPRRPVRRPPSADPSRFAPEPRTVASLLRRLVIVCPLVLSAPSPPDREVTLDLAAHGDPALPGGHGSRALSDGTGAAQGCLVPRFRTRRIHHPRQLRCQLRIGFEDLAKLEAQRCTGVAIIRRLGDVGG